MIYVDKAEWKKPNGRVSYAHMTADSLEELHAFAKSIGVKRHWYHSKSRYPHYDINSEVRQTAIDNGAIEVDGKKIVEVAKKLFVPKRINKTK